MTAAAISVESVWKRFARTELGRPTVKRLLTRPLDYRRREYFWALADINVELPPGETLGLIGANGSGKSTLLRLIAGLGRPTRGRIRRSSEVSAMMTLGEAFDPLLTGRENAITACIVAGRTRREALASLDQIVAFSELEEVIDRPIRTYSDGMRARLAFAVAISTEPKLMVIDEVLSVGDLRFQQRCIERLAELKEQGTTIVLASHDEGQVRRLCDRVLWLSHGRMQALGDPDSVYEAYRGAMRTETERRSLEIEGRPWYAPADLRVNENRFGTFEVEIAAVRVTPAALGVGAPDRSRPLEVAIDLEPKVPVDDPIVGVSMHRVSDGSKTFDVSTEGDGVALGRLARPTTVTLRLERVDAEPGLYRLDVGIYERHWSYAYDYHWQAYPLELVADAGGFGPARSWRVEAPPDGSSD